MTIRVCLIIQIYKIIIMIQRKKICVLVIIWTKGKCNNLKISTYKSLNLVYVFINNLNIFWNDYEKWLFAGVKYYINCMILLCNKI